MKRKIALILVIALVVAVLAGCGERGEPLSWSGLLLGENLPKLDGAVGEVRNNTLEKLELRVQDISEMKFGEYMTKCRDFGYEIDVDQTMSNSYTAFHENGYKVELMLWGSSEEMDICLTAPRKMEEIVWPDTGFVAEVPAPASTMGSVYSDSETYYSVYVGETSKEAYADYVQLCKDAGFNVDCNESEKRFYALNETGVTLEISYEGGDVIFIIVKIVAAENSEEATEPEATEPEVTEPKEEYRSDFKKAMDEYEEFMDEYVSFMKKYKDNPTDTGLLSEYADFMSDYTEYVDAFEEWDEDEMNDAEVAYYLEVQTRVNKKLLEVAY